MHEHLLLVSVSFAEIPRVSAAERAEVTPVCTGVARVELRYGFMEQPNVPLGLSEAVSLGRIEPCRLESVIYFTGHETINALGRLPQMARWRESVYTLDAPQRPASGSVFQNPGIADHGDRRRVRNLTRAAVRSRSVLVVLVIRRRHRLQFRDLPPDSRTSARRSRRGWRRPRGRAGRSATRSDCDPFDQEKLIGGLKRCSGFRSEPGSNSFGSGGAGPTK